MRSLYNKSKACRESYADERNQERDKRAGEYVQALKRHCSGSRWNLVEIEPHRLEQIKNSKTGRRN